MEVIRIEDLELKDAVKFLKDKRHRKEPDEVYERYVKECVGGRLAFLNRLAKANDLEGKHGKTNNHGLFYSPAGYSRPLLLYFLCVCSHD